MTIREMHISLDVHLNKIDSQKFANFQPEEKDLMLNAAQVRFLKNRINDWSIESRGHGFQEVQKRLDDVQQLVEPVTLPVYKLDSEHVYSILPSNYFSLVDDASYVKRNCRGIDISETTTSLYYYELSLEELIPYTSLTMLDSLVSTPQGSVALLNTTNLPYYTSISDEDLKFNLVNLIMQEMSKVSGYSVYYEVFNTTYKRDTIFIVKTTNNLDTLYVSWTTTNSPLSAVNLTSYALNTLNLTSVGTSESITSKKYPNRLTRSDIKNNLAVHPFGKTIYHSPLSEIKRGRLEVQHNDNFIVDSVVINYIRWPRLMDINFGNNCELSANVHHEIVDLAVQRMKAEISENNYSAIVQETLKKE